MYLLWFDDSRRPVQEKIAAACAAYRDRFGVAPTTVMVNKADEVRVPGLLIRAEDYVRRNNFWVGHET